GLDAAALARWQDSDFIALAHDAAGQSAGKTSEVQVWPVDILYREAQVVEVAVAGDLDAFQDFHQRLALIPGRALAAVDHVVALERRHGHEMQRCRLEADTLGEREVIAANAFEHALIEVHQIHLVDGNDDMANAQQGRDKAVATSLGLHAVTG